MPLYEYRCRSCGSSFERRLSYDDRLRPQRCPTCDAEGATLLLSVPAPARAGAPARAADGPICPGSGGPCGCGAGLS